MKFKILILTLVLAGFNPASTMAMQPQKCEKVYRKGSWLPFYFCRQKQDLSAGLFYSFRLLAECAGKPHHSSEIGHATALCEDKNGCELTTLSIQPQFQNKGWGSWFLQKSLTFLKKKNYEQVGLAAVPVSLKKSPYEELLDKDARLMLKEKNTHCDKLHNQYIEQLLFAAANEQQATERKLYSFYKKNGGQRPTDEECKDNKACDNVFVFPLTQKR